ncbi:MAG: hypothetical protein JOY93_11875 [Acidobacteriales bacterium]|nr:hypothetical protein [Terriglobales bacterium]
MNPAKKIYVTLSGLPLSFELQWPFHKSTSGADFSVLHADIHLENSEGLHAPVAVNLSATVREVLPSLEPGDAEAPVINALRTEVDRRQVEFVKSGKRIPVQFSSRHYDFKRSKWVFGKASDEQVQLLITGKVYWQTRLGGSPVWMADPTEALYVERNIEAWMQAVQTAAAARLIKLEGDWATGSDTLAARTLEFETRMNSAREELEKKHAFERG